MKQLLRTAAILVSVSLPGAVHAQDEVERLYWESVNCNSEIEVRTYLEQYPDGAYADAAFECIRTAGEESPEDQVAERLKTCRIHVEANRLTTGAGGTALDCYRSVLELDADNVEALSGLNEIENTYIRWTQSDIDEGEIDRAQGNLEKLKQLNPERREISKLEDDIAQLRRQAREEEQRKQQAIQEAKREEERKRQQATEEVKRREEEERRRQEALEQARIEAERERLAREEAERQKAAAAAAAAAHPSAYEVPLRLVQQSGGQCVLWGCIATIEIYIDSTKTFEIVRRLDLPLDQVVWRGNLARGEHEIHVAVHYKGKRREDFRSQIQAASADPLTVYVGHVGKLMTGHFHPQIQVFYGGNELVNAGEPSSTETKSSTTKSTK